MVCRRQRSSSSGYIRVPYRRFIYRCTRLGQSRQSHFIQQLFVQSFFQFRLHFLYYLLVVILFCEMMWGVQTSRASTFLLIRVPGVSGRSFSLSRFSLSWVSLSFSSLMAFCISETTKLVDRIIAFCNCLTYFFVGSVSVFSADPLPVPLFCAGATTGPGPGTVLTLQLVDLSVLEYLPPLRLVVYAQIAIPQQLKPVKLPDFTRPET